MISDHYGKRAYMLTSMGQGLRGLLAFLASPAVGALSDVVGRKYLFVVCITCRRPPDELHPPDEPEQLELTSCISLSLSALQI